MKQNLWILACLLIQIRLSASDLVHDLTLVGNTLHLYAELNSSGLIIVGIQVSFFVSDRQLKYSFDTAKSLFFLLRLTLFSARLGNNAPYEQFVRLICRSSHPSIKSHSHTIMLNRCINVRSLLNSNCV